VTIYAQFDDNGGIRARDLSRTVNVTDSGVVTRLRGFSHQNAQVPARIAF
jgi:hypothetical protein